MSVGHELRERYKRLGKRKQKKIATKYGIGEDEKWGGNKDYETYKNETPVLVPKL